MDDILLKKALQFVKKHNLDVLESKPKSYKLQGTVMFRGLEDPSYITVQGTSWVEAVKKYNALLDTMKKVQDLRSASEKAFWRTLY
jgi:hypothetical protein